MRPGVARTVSSGGTKSTADGRPGEGRPANADGSPGLMVASVSGKLRRPNEHPRVRT
jgi:hypothetical protein